MNDSGCDNKVKTFVCALRIPSEQIVKTEDRFWCDTNGTETARNVYSQDTEREIL